MEMFVFRTLNSHVNIYCSKTLHNVKTAISVSLNINISHVQLLQEIKLPLSKTRHYGEDLMTTCFHCTDR